jgi:nitrogen fixation/metabolism regulation signal transduction histidine kinase
MGFVARSTLTFAVALAAVAAASWAAGASGEVLAATLGTGAAALLFVAWRARRVAAVHRALADGLLSYAERDYSLRLGVRRRDELGEAARRFNRLGERLRAEHNDVYQKEMLLETVLQSAPMAIVLADEAGRVVLSNRDARALFAEGRRLEGQAFESLLPGAPAELQAALRGGRDGLCTAERAGEVETWHVAHRFFHIDTQRHHLYLIEPLTRPIARQEVETWKKVIRVISHELNNSLAPISSMMHSARLILRNPAHAHRLEGVFDTVEERTHHLRTFLEGYARFARLPRPIPQAEPWGPFLARVQVMAPFALEGDPPEAPGWFDRAQMEQVLLNLLKNATEAGSPPDEVRVRLDPLPGGAVRLSVLDRGRGMSDEVLGKALLPFYSTKQTGTGLGLPLCREIIDAHGGRLRLEARDGGGTAVVCTLPGAPAPA